MPFVLNDETQLNSYGFKIKTSGISLKRFKNNPVMLDYHLHGNQSVIGKWLDLKKENGLLTAEPEFDKDDKNAQEIAGKVQRGYIKGASMGIEFEMEDFKNVDGELVLEKCSIYEASIVSIPSNPGALKLYQNGELLSKSDVKALCLSVAQNTPTPPEKTEPKKKNIPMKLQLSQLAFVALGFDNHTKELDPEIVNQAILKLSKDNENLTTVNAELKTKVQEFETKEKQAKEKQATDLVDLALKEGRITADKKDTFLSLAQSNYELAKDTIAAMPAKKTFSTGVSTPTTGAEPMKLDDFEKLSTQEQLSYKENNPEAYALMIKNL